MANIPISQLTDRTQILATDYFPINNSGSNPTTYRVYLSTLSSWLASNATALTASFVDSASLADTASYALVADTGSSVETASYALYAISCSYADWSKSGSWAETASWAATASWALGGNVSPGTGTPYWFVVWDAAGTALDSGSIIQSSSLLDVRKPLLFSDNNASNKEWITLYSASIGGNDNRYAIGVQDGMTYVRTGKGFAIFESGSFSSTALDPGVHRGASQYGKTRFCVYRDTVGIGNFNGDLNNQFPGADLHISSSYALAGYHFLVTNPTLGVLCAISSSGHVGFGKYYPKHRVDVSGSLNASSYWVDDPANGGQYLSGKTFTGYFASTSSVAITMSFTNGIITGWGIDTTSVSGVQNPPAITAAGGSCLLYGTKVYKKDYGPVSIETLEVGDEILSLDMGNPALPNEIYVAVLNIVKSTYYNYYVINEKLKVTPQHELVVYRPDVGMWQMMWSQDVRVGDFLMTVNGAKEITSIRKEYAPVNDVDLKVSSPNTFIADSFLVHNYRTQFSKI